MNLPVVAFKDYRERLTILCIVYMQMRRTMYHSAVPSHGRTNYILYHISINGGGIRETVYCLLNFNASTLQIHSCRKTIENQR